MRGDFVRLAKNDVVPGLDRAQFKMLKLAFGGYRRPTVVQIVELCKGQLGEVPDRVGGRPVHPPVSGLASYNSPRK